MTRSLPTIYDSFNDFLPTESVAQFSSNDDDDTHSQNAETERTRLLPPALSSTTMTTRCEDHFCCSYFLSNSQRYCCDNIPPTKQPKRQQQQQQKEQLAPSPPQQRPPTVQEFFFSNHRATNHHSVSYNYYYSPPPFTVQRYYRFQVTAQTPCLSLFERPAENSSSTHDCQAGNDHPTASALWPNAVTAMIRRSIVLPSHGTDATGQWILVGVGGRSGWVRKQENAVPNDNKSISILPLVSSSSSASNQASERRSLGAVDGGYMTLTTNFVAYEAWQGNHQFYFQGRIMLGPDAPLFLFTNSVCAWSVLVQFGVILPQLVLLLSSSSLDPSNDNDYSSFSKLDETNHFHPYLSVIVWGMSAIGTILVFVTLWMTALGDPGILPPISSPLRPPPPVDDVSQAEKQSTTLYPHHHNNNNHSDRHVLPPQPSSSPFRYCAICNLYQPPRSKHCHACNVCVTRMDHHCPWLGTCIGARNHARFFGFLCSLTASAVLISVCTVYTIVRQFLVLEQQEQQKEAFLPQSQRSSTILMFHGLPSSFNFSDISWPSSSSDRSAIHYAERSSRTVWQTICFMPFTIFLGIFFVASAWSLVSLLFYHVMIISQGQTAHERGRGIYYKSRRRRSSSRQRASRGKTESNNKYGHQIGSNNIDESHAAAASDHRKQNICYNSTSNRNNDHEPNRDDALPASADCHCFHDHTSSSSSTWIRNPYDRGFWHNWWYFFVEPRPFSLLPADFSQHVIYTEQQRPELLWRTREAEEPTSMMSV